MCQFTCLTLTNSSLHLPLRSRSCCFRSRETTSSQVSMRKLPASFISMCCCIQWGRFRKKIWREKQHTSQSFSANSIRRKWRRTGCTRLTCAYTLGVLRLAEHALSVLQPGLESRHAAGVLLPVGYHLLQHAAHAAHLQGQVLPLRRGVIEEFTHPLDFVDCKQEDTFSIQQMVTRDDGRWVTRRLGLMLQRIGKLNLSEHSSRCNYCYFCHASSNVMIVFVLFFRWKKGKGLLRKSAVPHSQKGGAQEMEKKKTVLRLSGSFFRLTSVTGFRPCNMKLIIKTSSKIGL